jgi:hypothetical protein
MASDDQNVQGKKPMPEDPDSLITSRILKGIDRGFEIYGKNVKDIFFKEMEVSLSITRSQILDNPEGFERALKQFFTAGAAIVDRSIGKEILREFELPQAAGLNFRTAIEIVRRHPSM